MEGRKIEASQLSTDLSALLLVKNWTHPEAWRLDNQSVEVEEEREEEEEEEEAQR